MKTVVMMVRCLAVMNAESWAVTTAVTMVGCSAVMKAVRWAVMMVDYWVPRYEGWEIGCDLVPLPFLSLNIHPIIVLTHSPHTKVTFLTNALAGNAFLEKETCSENDSK